MELLDEDGNVLEKDFKIDYPYYEKKFHERRYMRPMALRMSKLDQLRMNNSSANFV